MDFQDRVEAMCARFDHRAEADGLHAVQLIGLAKREETIHRETGTISLSRRSEALKLLQRVRDEAHRFAITYHRQLRGKAATKSVLDDLPGVGPARKRLNSETPVVGADGRKRDLKRQSWLALGRAPECPSYDYNVRHA